jgi:hypothetical protein
MAGFAVVRGDDLIALVTCFAALCLCGLTLQLVHFIQHRKRPTSIDEAKLSETKSVTRPLPQSRHHDSAA